MKNLKLEINTNEKGVSTMNAYRAHYYDKNDTESYGKIYLSKDKVLEEIKVYTQILDLYEIGFVDRLLIFV